MSFNPEQCDSVILPEGHIDASLRAVQTTLGEAGVMLPDVHAVSESGVTTGQIAGLDFTLRNIGPYDSFRFVLEQMDPGELLWLVQGNRFDRTYDYEQFVQPIPGSSELMCQSTRFSRSPLGEIAVMRHVLAPADYATPDRKLRGLFGLQPIQYDMLD